MPSGSIVKTVVWSALEQGSSKAVSLIVQITLARLLTPEAFGVLAILLVVTSIADAVAQSGLGSAIIQKKEGGEVVYSTAFWLSMCISAVLFATILFISPLLGIFYNMPGLGTYLKALAVVVFFNSANSIQRSILQKSMDFKSLFLTSLSAAVASGAVGVAAAFSGWGVWALVAQVVTQSVAACFAMAVRVPWRPTLRFDRQEAKGLFSYGWKIAATGILGVLYNGISSLVVGKVCSTVALGHYSQGRKYPIAVMTMATNAIQNVMFPALAKKQSDKQAFAQAANRALVTGTFLIAPLSLFCASAAESIVTLLLTDRWLPCVPIFQMVCVSYSTMMMTSVNLRAYMALGRSDLYLRLQLAKVLVGIVLICGVTIATHDIYLTALATCLSTMFNSLIFDTSCAKSTYGYSAVRQVLDIAPSVMLATVSAAISFAPSFVISDHAILLVAQIVMYWGSYLALARLLNMQGLSDCLEIIKSLTPRGKGGLKR